MALITPYWVLDIVLILLSFIITAYLYMMRKFKYWERRGIIEIQPTPFVGNFADILLSRTSPGESLKDLYNKSEGLDYVGFYVFDKPALLLRDPAIIKDVLIKDFDCFANRYAASNDYDVLGTANLFSLRNPHWKELRNKLTPIFSPGKLRKMLNLMIAVAEDLTTHLEALNLEGDGQVVELKEICAKFTTDSIASCAFGIRANSLNKPDAEFRKYGRMIYAPTFGRSFDFGAIFFASFLVRPFQCTMFGKPCSNFLRDAFWRTTNTRIQTGDMRDDLIDILIELKNDQTKSGFNDPEAFKLDGDNLVAQATIFFSAGFETSSTTMAFTLYELALQSDIQTRLRNEINSALEENEGGLTYEMVMNLPYLDMVVSETLRKYPTLPFLDRIAARDYKISGTDLVIEKDTPVYISLLGLHYDPRYFSDPEKYDPERFSDENTQNRPSTVYIPFGEGPRACIGMRFGVLQSKLGLITVLSKYEVTVCDRTQIPMLLHPRGLFITSRNAIHLNMRKIAV